MIVGEGIGPLDKSQVDYGQSEVVREGVAEEVKREGEIQEPHPHKLGLLTYNYMYNEN